MGEVVQVIGTASIIQIIGKTKVASRVINEMTRRTEAVAAFFESINNLFAGDNSQLQDSNDTITIKSVMTHTTKKE
jgi:hypothetical protein